MKKPVSFIRFKNFYNLDDKGVSTEQAEKMYSAYLQEVEKEEECYKNTRHRNQKQSGIAGYYVCLDCGAWYV